MATSVREDVVGGSTVIAAKCLTITERSASEARASPSLASAKRHQLRVLGRKPDDEVVEALRLDAVDEMAALLAGTHVSSGCEEEDEEEDGGGDENTGRERRSPQAYDELSSHFGVLEAAAEESGNGDTAFHLTRATMAKIAAHSAKRVRQADMREFVET